MTEQQKSQATTGKTSTTGSVLNLLVDTCVWLDLAKQTDGEKMIATIRTLCHQDQIRLLVPKLVVDEFTRNRDRVEADMTRSMNATFQKVRAAVNEHGQGAGRDEALKQLDEVTYRLPLVRQMATRHFDEILELLSQGTTIEPTSELDRRVVDRALTKKAPFHRAKNSVADALLIEMYGAAVDGTGNDSDIYSFVTHNTNDFSAPSSDTRFHHSDFGHIFASPRSSYFTTLAAALRAAFPDDVDELLTEFDFQEEPRSLSEIRPLLDKLWNQIWYNRHKDLEYAIATGDVKLVEEFNREDAQHTVVASVWEQAKAAARRLEEKYESDDLGPWTDFEWGMISGKMSALRWAMGEDWESTLDT
jgi:hypothetical protein